MTYNVFSGTLNLTQSINREDPFRSFHYVKLLTDKQTNKRRALHISTKLAEVITLAVPFMTHLCNNEA